MPADPPAIFTPPSASPPSAPGVLFVPPSASPPSAPGVVYQPPITSASGMRITGTSGADGDLPSVGDGDLDGFATYNGPTQQIYHSAGNWVIASASYGAFKASSAATPDGLTGWTITLGTGQPTVAAFGISSPPVIFTPP